MPPTHHQLTELRKATAGPIGILGGGPGVGKTFTVAHLVRSVIPKFGIDQICIGAPTGKAAVRVTEVLDGHGIPLRARTWHSILRGGPDGNFQYGPGDPLPYKVLISDESSMIDLGLMAAILSARARGTLLLLVGDINQLPPVGRGAPLRDMIAAGLPYGELTEIKRNSGGIVEACAAIREGRRWEPGDNLILAETGSADEQIARLTQLLSLWHSQGIDPVWDAQVLVAVNDKSPLSRRKINGLLQQAFNPGGRKAGNNPFRVGDKVVCLKNSYLPTIDYDEDDPDLEIDENGKAYVANGEIGRVVEVEDRVTVVKLDAPARTVKVLRGGKDNPKSAGGGGNGVDSDGGGGSEDADTPGDSDKSAAGCDWDLAYALSVHKSQGSEFRRVVILLDEYPGARRVCSREFLHTAISRAKEQCVLIGKRSVADDMVRRPSLHYRKTFLREKILAERARRTLEGI